MLIALIVVAGLLVYAWIVYPGLMLLLGRGWGQGSASVAKAMAAKGFRVQGEEDFPPVAILFSAHNEEVVILKRLENLAALDYPADCLHIFAGIDGGTDRTAEIALQWAQSHPNVHVIVSPQNHGKTAMLKRLVESVGSGQVAVGSKEGAAHCPLSTAHGLLVFTDANTFFAPDALRRLVAPFSDPHVGGVCGRLVFVGAENPSPQRHGDTEKTFSSLSSSSPCLRVSVVKSSSSQGTDEPVYWNLETRLKEAESGLDSCLGANGAIYALRPELFWEAIPDSTIIDDFVLGMKVREQGFRMVFEPAAVATEDLPSTVQDEWRRRVRIGAGAFQALALCRSCLSPRFGVFAWMFWSHKVLRWFTPHLGIGLLVMGCWLWVDSSWSGGLGYWLVALSAAAIVSLVASPVRKGLKGMAYFLAMQAALFVGFLRYCRGGLKGTWERTERGEKRDFTTDLH